MRIILLSGEIIVTEGDTPVLQSNGLYRFDKSKDFGPWSVVGETTKDPLIPATNVSYMEQNPAPTIRPKLPTVSVIDTPHGPVYCSRKTEEWIAKQIGPFDKSGIIAAADKLAEECLSKGVTAFPFLDYP